MNYKEHNKRVSELAARVPDGILSKAVKAIGYAANFDTGITSGYSREQLARMTNGPKRAKRDRISEASIKRAVSTLQAMGTLKVERGAYDKATGQRKPNSYTLDYDWQPMSDEDIEAELERMNAEPIAKGQVKTRVMSPVVWCDVCKEPHHGPACSET